jgi:hypothetical protein
MVVEDCVLDWPLCHDVLVFTDAAFLSSIELARPHAADGWYPVRAYDLVIRDPVLEGPTIRMERKGVPQQVEASKLTRHPGLTVDPELVDASMRESSNPPAV